MRFFVYNVKKGKVCLWEGGIDMGIEGVKAAEGFAGNQAKAAESHARNQAKAAESVDAVSKSIQNEIEEVQRKKQSLSSDDDVSVEEKAKKRKELQQELRSLNEKLRQRQAEIRREQQKEAAAGELRAENGRDSEEKKAGLKADEKQKAKQDGAGGSDQKAGAADRKDLKEKKTDAREMKEEQAQAQEAGMPADEVRRFTAAGAAVDQNRQRGMILARMEGGMVILKGEIDLDEVREEDTEKKRAELKEQEERLRQAAAMQFPDLTKPHGVGEEAVQVTVG